MRKFNVNVNGKSYSVEVEETEGGANANSISVAPAAPAAAKPAVVVGGTMVESPMPGIILKLVVANGATVKKGAKIIVLEAMKMENDIFAATDGVVTFLVKQGDTVESGATLASIK